MRAWPGPCGGWVRSRVGRRWRAPAITGKAIYATDILLRRNRYDGRALTDETPGGTYWYTAGVNRAGVTALATGTAAAVLCVSTELYVGPPARAAGGIDLALPVGMVIAATVYALPTRRRHRLRPSNAPPPPSTPFRHTAATVYALPTRRRHRLRPSDTPPPPSTPFRHAAATVYALPARRRLTAAVSRPH
ncbi:cytosine permease [Streptomyces sp. NPDC051658]|uniref:cytosine permease n=1 Tax=Streptomyces sp. NPDC051658 TaxID=3365667 RepID=UPI0037B4643F